MSKGVFTVELDFEDEEGVEYSTVYTRLKNDLAVMFPNATTKIGLVCIGPSSASEESEFTVQVYSKWSMYV